MFIRQWLSGNVSKWRRPHVCATLKHPPVLARTIPTTQIQSADVSAFRCHTGKLLPTAADALWKDHGRRGDTFCLVHDIRCWFQIVHAKCWISQRIGVCLSRFRRCVFLFGVHAIHYGILQPLVCRDAYYQLLLSPLAPSMPWHPSMWILEL